MAADGSPETRSWQQAFVPAAAHALLTGYALWARGGKAHWLGRVGLALFAVMFALQTAAALTRNKTLIDWTYRRGLVHLEWVGLAGLLGGTIADRRRFLAAPLALSAFLIGPLGRSGARRLAGQLLFFATLARYRMGSLSADRDGEGERR